MSILTFAEAKSRLTTYNLDFEKPEFTKTELGFS